jgi:hypothetical protein
MWWRSYKVGDFPPKKESAMQNEARRLAERFQPLFENGLTDVKFFVPHPEACSLQELLAEASDIQDAIAGGKIRVVEGVDAHFERVAFDAPF